MMLRKTLTILSLIGLLLSVGLWGVSYFWVRFFSETWWLEVQCGALQFSWCPGLIYEARGWGYQGFYNFQTTWTPYWDYHSPMNYVFCVPFWIPTLLFAFAFWLSYAPLYRRRKRKKLGLCLKCGYDLRGSKDRCPECNTPFALDAK